MSQNIRRTKPKHRHHAHHKAHVCQASEIKFKKTKFQACKNDSGGRITTHGDTRRGNLNPVSIGSPRGVNYQLGLENK